jgi:hypothetical protein
MRPERGTNTANIRFTLSDNLKTAKISDAKLEWVHLEHFAYLLSDSTVDVMTSIKKITRLISAFYRMKSVHTCYSLIWLLIRFKSRSIMNIKVRVRGMDTKVNCSEWNLTWTPFGIECVSGCPSSDLQFDFTVISFFLSERIELLSNYEHPQNCFQGRAKPFLLPTLPSPTALTLPTRVYFTNSSGMCYTTCPAAHACRRARIERIFAPFVEIASKLRDDDNYYDKNTAVHKLALKSHIRW